MQRHWRACKRHGAGRKAAEENRGVKVRLATHGAKMAPPTA